MKKQLAILASVSTLALLAACGGGGDAATTTTTTTTTTTASAVDKYVGTWVGCFADGAGSFHENLAITKTGDTTASFTFTGTGYSAANCVGTVTGTENGSGTVTLDGTKVIGANTVDRAITQEGSDPTEKQVFLVQGSGPITLGFGVTAADGGSVDADGYPNTLDSDTLTKQ